ncbi:Inner membrane protein YiaW [compost metagenome]
MLIFAGLVLFYGIIVLHDIPYEIAVHRNHPHQDAIHATGWVSLFTLHALWPFLWIWAMLYREDRGWGIGTITGLDRHSPAAELQQQIVELQQRVAHLEARQANPRDSEYESGGGI